MSLLKSLLFDSLRCFRGIILVFIISLILALLSLTWAGFDFHFLSTAYIGDRGDTLLNSWTIQQAMDNLIQHPTDLGYSRIFYGERSSFAYTIAPYGIALLTLPVYKLSHDNLFLTYNLYLIATFVLTAMAGYLLIRFLLPLSIWPALIAALMIAFAQRRFVHITQVETLSFQFCILCLYFLHRLLESPRRIWQIGLGVIFWFTFFTSGYLMMMFIVSALVILLYLWKLEKLTAAHIKRLTVSGLITVILCAPFLLFRLQNSTFRTGYNLDEVVNYSPSLESWLVGSSQIYRRPTIKAESLFLGFVPIGLALAAWHWRPRKSQESANTASSTRLFSPDQVIVIYGLITLVGYFLSLGPILKINGDEIIPLPTMVLYQLPGYGLIRAPGRFIFLPILGTGLLAAYAFNLLAQRSKPAHRLIIVSAVVVALSMELVPYNGENINKIIATGPQGNQTISPYQINGDVYAWLSTQPADAAIFHFPLGNNGEYQYLADLGRSSQPMLNGWGSFLPPWYWSGILQQFPSAESIHFLQDRGIRFVLVHREWLNVLEQFNFEQRLTAFEKDHGQLDIAGKFENVTVYIVPSQRP